MKNQEILQSLANILTFSPWPTAGAEEQDPI